MATTDVEKLKSRIKKLQEENKALKEKNKQLKNKAAEYKAQYRATDRWLTDLGRGSTKLLKELLCLLESSQARIDITKSKIDTAQNNIKRFAVDSPLSFLDLN